MRIWEPCPACGATGWRPGHAAAAHGADVADLDDLVRWADEVSR